MQLSGLFAIRPKNISHPVSYGRLLNLASRAGNTGETVSDDLPVESDLLDLQQTG